MKERLKILVVDDEEVMINMATLILSDDAYEICKAFDGEEAILQARDESPDLIILDCMMPVMDGLTACKILKSDPTTRNIPVIIWTGNESIEIPITAYDVGADHFILKPFHNGLLKALIRNSLSRAGHKLSTSSELNKVPKIPKVFISYKWESDDHNDWVMEFAVTLRRAGIDASFDRWEVRYGDSFTDYMTSKISEADVLLFIMTTASVEAVEAGAGKGGAVKFEMQLASSRRIAGENFRIIPIYREGNKTAAHLRDHRYADFRDDSKYETNIQLLIADILQSGPLPPPLGTS